MAIVVQFKFVARGPQAWSNAELAEFARAITLLRGAGLPVISESGLSDEGDPWTIFLREDTGDVVAHLARIDGRIIAASITTDEIFSGIDFRAVLDQIVKRQPLVLPSGKQGERLFMHPAAILTAFVATAVSNAALDTHPEQAALWSVSADGSLNLKPAAAEAVGPINLLRAALTSKAETQRHGDSHGGMSANHLIAAAIAAVTVALAVPELGDDHWQAALTSGSDSRLAQADSAQAERQLASMSVDTFSPGAGDVAAGQQALVFAEEFGIAENAGFESLQSGNERFEAAWPRALDAVAHEVTHASVLQPLDSSIDRGDRTAAGLTGDTALSAGAEALQPAPTVAIAAAPGRAAGHGADYDIPPATDLHEFVISAEATKLFQLKVSAGFVSLGDSQWTIFDSSGRATLSFDSSFGTDVDIANQVRDRDMQLLSGIAIDVADAVTDSSTSALAHQPSEAANDASYRLIGEVLSFAFEERNELTLSVSQLAQISQMVFDTPFLPSAERILIIDTVDLRSELFNFADGVLMMSRSKAAELLPQAHLGTDVELSLANGASLGLIGVIDLQQVV